LISLSGKRWYIDLREQKDWHNHVKSLPAGAEEEGVVAE
jgi:hypothetical protein